MSKQNMLRRVFSTTQVLKIKDRVLNEVASSPVQGKTTRILEIVHDSTITSAKKAGEVAKEGVRDLAGSAKKKVKDLAGSAKEKVKGLVSTAIKGIKYTASIEAAVGICEGFNDDKENEPLPELLARRGRSVVQKIEESFAKQLEELEGEGKPIYANDSFASAPVITTVGAVVAHVTGEKKILAALNVGVEMSSVIPKELLAATRDTTHCIGRHARRSLRQSPKKVPSPEKKIPSPEKKIGSPVKGCLQSPTISPGKSSAKAILGGVSKASRGISF